MKEVINILFIIILFACSSDLNKREYIAWCKDYQNGIHKQKSVSDFYFDLQYQPKQYLEILRGESGNLEKNNIEQYNLKIGLNNKKNDILKELSSNLNERKNLEYYLSYKFQNDIYLKVNQEKIKCQLFHFEKAIRKDNAIFFTAGFPVDVENKEVTFVVESSYFSSLPIKIKINKSNIPELTI